MVCFPGNWGNDSFWSQANAETLSNTVAHPYSRLPKWNCRRRSAAWREKEIDKEKTNLERKIRKTKAKKEKELG